MNNILSLGKNCCGCGGCSDICPKQSIEFEYDKEGFLYPVVSDSCVGCGLCLKHCPVAVEAQKPELQQVYAVRLRDNETTLKKSTSGGAFAPLAEEILERDGVVFGCAFDETLAARHIAVENKKDLVKLQGSKYVQSNTLGVFKEVKELLETGRNVLFSGTGCQVSGLKNFLGKDYLNLFTVDIVCHGVPSPRLFENYIAYLSLKETSVIKEYDFRNKEKKGWSLYYKYTTAKKSKTNYGFFDPYYYAFLMCQNYREGCYSCQYSSEKRAGDITLADFWSIKKTHPEFYNKRGNSVVIINSTKGEKLWKNINPRFDFVSSTYENASLYNDNLLVPSPRPDCRDDFYAGMDEDLVKYFNKKLRPPFQPKARIKQLIPEKFKNLFR